MAKQELLGEVKKLITIGKEKGFLTYDELNNTLPAEVVSSDQFGSIMTMFGDLDIEIVDAPDGERTQKRTERGEAGDDAEEAETETEAEAEEENENPIDLTPGALSRTDDPVRLYLKEMGSVAYRYWGLVAFLWIGLLCIPWSSSIYVPGVLTFANYTILFSSESAQVISMDIKPGQQVAKDHVLMVLKSPQLEKEIEITRKQLNLLEIRANRAVSYAQDQEDLTVILQQIAVESSNLAGLEKEQAKLTLRAPFSGIVAEVAEDLHLYQWINQDKPICLIVDPFSAEIRGVVAEHELDRLVLGQQAQSYPENLELPKLTASISRIDWGDIQSLDLPYLASKFGGSIAVKEHAATLVPKSSVYAIYLSNISTTVPQQEMRGEILIEGKPISFARRFLEKAVSVLIRESGY